MKEKIYHFKSDKYISGRNNPDAKKLLKIWNLIHKNSDLDLTPKPLDNYKKYCLPFRGVSKFKDGTTEYDGEMLGYLNRKNKIERYFDCPHGKGINFSSHGFKFIFNGYWKYGFAHGKGVFLNSYGEFFVGIWKKGYFSKLIHEFKWSPGINDKKFHLGKLTKVKKPKKNESMNCYYPFKVKTGESNLYSNFGVNANFEVLDLNANYCLSRGGVTDGIPDPEQSVEELMELHSDKEFFRDNYILGKKNNIINLKTPRIKELTPEEHYPENHKKNFEETQIIEETGHRGFFVFSDYSKKEDFKVYKNGKILKLYNKKYDDKNLKLFTNKFNSYYVIENGGAFLAVKDKTIPYGVRFILLGDESYLKTGEKVRFVRKIKKR